MQALARLERLDPADEARIPVQLARQPGQEHRGQALVRRGADEPLAQRQGERRRGRQRQLVVRQALEVDPGGRACRVLVQPEARLGAAERPPRRRVQGAGELHAIQPGAQRGRHGTDGEEVVAQLGRLRAGVVPGHSRAQQRLHVLGLGLVLVEGQDGDERVAAHERDALAEPLRVLDAREGLPLHAVVVQRGEDAIERSGVGDTVGEREHGGPAGLGAQAGEHRAAEERADVVVVGEARGAGRLRQQAVERGRGPVDPERGVALLDLVPVPAVDVEVEGGHPVRARVEVACGGVGRRLVAAAAGHGEAREQDGEDGGAPHDRLRTRSRGASPRRCQGVGVSSASGSAASSAAATTLRSALESART